MPLIYLLLDILDVIFIVEPLVPSLKNTHRFSEQNLFIGEIYN